MSDWPLPFHYQQAQLHCALLCMQLRSVPLYGKMAGAVGNYNAHISAYPDVQWDAVAKHFVTGLGLQLNPYVTQVTTGWRPSNFGVPCRTPWGVRGGEGSFLRFPQIICCCVAHGKLFCSGHASVLLQNTVCARPSRVSCSARVH